MNATALLLRRLALLPVTIVGVAVLVFACLNLTPGDPVEIMLGEAAAPGDVTALRHALGLDLPLLPRLGRFLLHAAQGDLGYSITYRAPVATVIAARYPATVELATAALLAAICVALPLGVLAAMRAGAATDRLARALSLIGTCVPGFFLGPLLILVFAMQLGWLPVSGRDAPGSVVLPAATLALGLIGLLVRLTRTSVLAVLREPFTRTAHAKGLSRARVTIVHVLRNALVPVVTVVGLQTGALLAGAVVTETVFAWPGLGRLVVQAIGARDYPLVQGCVLALAVSYVAVNTLADVVCAALDPRGRDAA